MKKAIIILVIIIAIIVSFAFFRKGDPGFVLGRVELSNISKEISETGQVKKGEAIDLSFKSNGKIEKIYVEIGDKVVKGELLAKIEIIELSIQIQEAKESLSLTNAQLDKLLAGSSQESIKVAETAVYNAEIAATNAKQNLNDVKAVAEINLAHAYEDALNILDDSYLEIYNAYNRVDLIQRTYFFENDQEGVIVRDNKNYIEIALSSVDYYLDTAKNSEEDKDIDKALIEMKSSLNKAYDALKVIRDMCEYGSYKNRVSSVDKGYLDTHKSNINSALTSITSSQQTIAATKVTNESNINTASSAVAVAEGALAAAQNQLELIKAPPRQEDIDLNQAQVNQAQSRVSLLESQIENAYLKSPVNGLVTKLHAREGELSSSKVVSLLPEEPFQIEVDIPEVDIGDIELGDPCVTILDAFPNTEFKGQVITIDPAETIIQGVVYYQTRVSIEEQDSKIKPGMTANVLVITEFKENVLVIPQRALVNKNDSVFIRIPKGNEYTEKEIIIGLKGSDGQVEVISGLEQGEEIIVSIKK